MSNKLSNIERIASLLIISIAALLILFNLISDDKTFPTLPKDEEKPVKLIEVTVEGAVRNPGIYQVRHGTQVSEVLKKAMPKDFANLKRIKLDSKITRRRKIVIYACEAGKLRK